MTTATTNNNEICYGLMIRTERNGVQMLECVECQYREVITPRMNIAHVKKTHEDYQKPMNSNDWQGRFAAIEERLQQAKGTLRVLPLSGILPARFVDEVQGRATMVEEALAALAEIQAEFAALVAAKEALSQAKPCGGDTDPISLDEIEETLKLAAAPAPARQALDGTILVPAVKVEVAQ